MNFLKKLAELRAANTAATESSRQAIEQADADHEVALRMRERASEQAGRLSAADQRNHYSESLTHSMRGKPA
jgi:hypothetical protein